MELYGETAQRVHWLTVPNGGTGCHPWTCCDHPNRYHVCVYDVRVTIPSVIVKQNTNFCLKIDGDSPYNGCPVHLWQCDQGDPGGWIYSRTPGTTYGQLRLGMDPSFCVGVSGSVATNGAQVVVWQCDQTYGWVWEPPRFKYKANTNQCLDFGGGTPGNGVTVTTWQCDQNNQGWIYDEP